MTNDEMLEEMYSNEHIKPLDMKGLGPKGPIDSSQLPLPKPDTNKLVKRAITLLAQSVHLLQLERSSKVYGDNYWKDEIKGHLKELASIHDKL